MTFQPFIILSRFANTNIAPLISAVFTLIQVSTPRFRLLTSPKSPRMPVSAHLVLVLLLIAINTVFTTRPSCSLWKGHPKVNVCLFSSYLCLSLVCSLLLLEDEHRSTCGISIEWAGTRIPLSNAPRSMRSMKNIDFYAEWRWCLFWLTWSPTRQSTDILLTDIQSEIRQGTGNGMTASRQITGLWRSFFWRL